MPCYFYYFQLADFKNVDSMWRHEGYNLLTKGVLFSLIKLGSTGAASWLKEVINEGEGILKMTLLSETSLSAMRDNVSSSWSQAIVNTVLWIVCNNFSAHLFHSEARKPNINKIKYNVHFPVYTSLTGFFLFFLSFRTQLVLFWERVAIKKTTNKKHTKVSEAVWHDHMLM